MSSVGSRLEKTDGIEGVPSCREKLCVFLAQKQFGEEDPKPDQACGVGQVLGFIRRESRSGQPHGLADSSHHSPAQVSRPRSNIFGTGSSEPILKAFGEFTGPI